MKKSMQLLTVFLCLCIANNTFSQTVQPNTPANPAAKQVPAPGATTISPFSKGTWNFVNQTNIDYDNYKSTDLSKASNLSIVIDPKYFLLIILPLVWKQKQLHLLIKKAVRLAPDTVHIMHA